MFEDKDEPDHIETIFDIFKIELGCRSTNTSTQSKMGGNISQLFYLLQKDVTIESDHSYVRKTIEKHKDTDSLTEELRKARDENHITPEFILKDNKLYLRYGKSEDKVTVKELRTILDVFFVQNDIELLIITEAQIVDIDYMKQFQGTSLNLDTFIKCVEECNKLKDYINFIGPIKESLKTKEKFDKKSFLLSFIKRYNLQHYINSEKQYDIVLKMLDKDTDFIKQFKDEESYNQVLKLLDNNPVYLKQYNDITASYDAIYSSLLGYREKECLTIINMMPKFISVAPCRLIIGLLNVINYNLDEYLYQPTVK